MGEPVVVQEEFSRPIRVVWEAITKSDQMTKWFFDTIPNFEPTVGFTTQFNVKAPSRDFLHLWKVEEATAPTKLVVEWRYEGIPGVGHVTKELSEIDGGTRLALTCSGMDSFPQDLPEFQRESCVGGWNYFIKEQLKAYLDG